MMSTPIKLKQTNKQKKCHVIAIVNMVLGFSSWKGPFNTENIYTHSQTSI